MPNKITGANAGRPLQLPVRTRWAARIAQFTSLGKFTFYAQSHIFGSPQPLAALRLSELFTPEERWTKFA
jgi:hypothetical protein